MENQNISQNNKDDKIEEMQKKIVEELGISDLSKDQQQELIVKMTEVILKRIFLSTMEKLGANDQEKYQGMIENNADSKEIDEFLKEKIENYDKMTEEIIQNFKMELKEGLSKN